MNVLLRIMKKKLSVLSDSDEELLSKSARKQRKDAVNGEPDQSDVNNIIRLFDLYDKSTGGRLRKMVNDNRLERALNDKDLKEESVDTAENLSFFLPKDLQEFMEKYYPTIWTNKEHLRWFLRQFPMLRR